MDAEIDILHTSGFYRIRNFKCNCTRCNISAPEFSKTFHFCFVRTGYFEFQTFRRNYETHIGRVLVTKPFFEHVTKHIDNQPDVCSVLDFTPDFFGQLAEHYRDRAAWFLNNRDIHSVLIQTDAEINYLHHLLLNKLFHSAQDNLLMDDLVVRLTDKIMRTLGNVTEPLPLPEPLKRYHLATIEKGRDFILKNFHRDIGLQQLADHCCVSLFHLSRIFKAVMNLSPHQFLLQIRLQHAQLLLRTTVLPISEISSQCGFSSMEYFASTFRNRFNGTPSALRKGNLVM
jgi:AraC family transcriptional regulator